MTKDWVHGIGYSPVCQIFLQSVVRAVITSSPPAWTSSVGMLSTPADKFCWDVVNSSWPPFLQWLYCSLHYFAKDGVVVLCVCLGIVQYWMISIGHVIVKLRAVLCPSVQYLSLFCDSFSWIILDSSSFPLFYSGQVFHELVCRLIVVLSQSFFNLTTLFYYPVFFCPSHAPLDVVVHFLVILRFFRFESVLSQFYPFVTDQEFLQCPRIFFVCRCLPRISLAVSVTAVLKVVIIESMSISSLFMMARVANFQPIILLCRQCPKKLKVWPAVPGQAPSLWCVQVKPIILGPSHLGTVPVGSPSRGGDVTAYVWHKPTELAHSFLFCSCVYFCLYGPFNCILFHKNLLTTLCFLTLFLWS